MAVRCVAIPPLRLAWLRLGCLAFEPRLLQSQFCQRVGDDCVGRTEVLQPLDCGGVIAFLELTSSLLNRLRACRSAASRRRRPSAAASACRFRVRASSWGRLVRERFACRSQRLSGFRRPNLREPRPVHDQSVAPAPGARTLLHRSQNALPQLASLRGLGLKLEGVVHEAQRSSQCVVAKSRFRLGDVRLEQMSISGVMHLLEQSDYLGIFFVKEGCLFGGGLGRLMSPLTSASSAASTCPVTFAFRSSLSRARSVSTRAFAPRGGGAVVGSAPGTGVGRAVSCSRYRAVYESRPGRLSAT